MRVKHSLVNFFGDKFLLDTYINFALHYPTGELSDKINRALHRTFAALVLHLGILALSTIGDPKPH